MYTALDEAQEIALAHLACHAHLNGTAEVDARIAVRALVAHPQGTNPTVTVLRPLRRLGYLTYERGVLRRPDTVRLTAKGMDWFYARTDTRPPQYDIVACLFDADGAEEQVWERGYEFFAASMWVEDLNAQARTSSGTSVLTFTARLIP